MEIHSHGHTFTVVGFKQMDFKDICDCLSRSNNLSLLHTGFDPVGDIDGHELKQKTKRDSIGFQSRQNRNLQKDAK